MRFLSKRQVLEMVPYSPTHLMRLVEEGQFPKPVRHTGYATKRTNFCKLFWVEKDVQDWMQALIDANEEATDPSR